MSTEVRNVITFLPLIFFYQIFVFLGEKIRRQFWAPGIAVVISAGPTQKKQKNPPIISLLWHC